MKKKLYSFYIFVDYLTKMKALATKRRVTVSYLLNQAIAHYLSKR